MWVDQSYRVGKEAELSGGGSKVVERRWSRVAEQGGRAEMLSEGGSIVLERGVGTALLGG